MGPIDSLAVESPSLQTSDAGWQLLRLILGQQIDAMLLTLGATAPDLDELVPRQRWLAEDLEVARMLSTTLASADVERTTVVGGGVAASSAARTLDQLLARYATMDELLTGMLTRASCGHSWRRTAAEARVRCRQRLRELHGYRAAVHRRDVHGTTSPAHHSRAFLPGELLG